jgi:predicted GNAT family acetyltransferase
LSDLPPDDRVQFTPLPLSGLRTRGSSLQEREIVQLEAEIQAASIRLLSETNRPEHAMAYAIKIDNLIDGKKGRYVVGIEDVDGEGELVFTVHGADHTHVPTSMRGTGAAMALVEHMIADTRAKGFKINPICPYVLAQYKKHPEWRDVLTNPPSAP